MPFSSTRSIPRPSSSAGMRCKRIPCSTGLVSPGGSPTIVWKGTRRHWMSSRQFSERARGMSGPRNPARPSARNSWKRRKNELAGRGNRGPLDPSSFSSLPAGAEKRGEKGRGLLPQDAGDHHRPVVESLVGSDPVEAVDRTRPGGGRPEDAFGKPGGDGGPRAPREP